MTPERLLVLFVVSLILFVGGREYGAARGRVPGRWDWIADWLALAGLIILVVTAVWSGVMLWDA